MHHFFTPNTGLMYENKQVSKQFSLYAKRTTVYERELICRSGGAPAQPLNQE